MTMIEVRDNDLLNTVSSFGTLNNFTSFCDWKIGVEVTLTFYIKCIELTCSEELHITQR